MGSRIGLLMVGHVDPTSVHVAGDYPELFGTLLAGRDIELVRYDLDLGRFPDRVTECDGWLCGPSRSPRPTTTCRGGPTPRRSCARSSPSKRRTSGSASATSSWRRRSVPAVERAADGWQVGALDYDVVTRTPWMDPACGSAHAASRVTRTRCVDAPARYRAARTRERRRVSDRGLHARATRVDAATPPRVRPATRRPSPRRDGSTPSAPTRVATRAGNTSPTTRSGAGRGVDRPLLLGDHQLIGRRR